MSEENPRVTVLMPVYNGEKYLNEAIESILNQTFTDFEFLIINDGSTDNSVRIIESYKDSRIRLIHNEKNLKLIATLNKGFDLASGEYLARMDCDDISLPERLARQVVFMDDHPEIGVCGTWAKKINADGRIFGAYKTYTGEKLEKFLWCPSPVIHPTAMIRKAVYKNYKYDPDFIDAEDYELWLRVSQKWKIQNLNEYLLLYRMHPQSISATKRSTQLQSAYKAFKKYYGSWDISFAEFLSFMYENLEMNPLVRAYKYRRIADKSRMQVSDFLQDNVKYVLLWLRAKIRCSG